MMNNMIEKIKNTLAALLSVLALLFSFGNEKIPMKISVEDTAEQIIHVEWTNLTGTVVYSAPRYSLEKQTNDIWEKVAFADDFGFVEIIAVVYPLQGGSFTIKSEEAFGEELSAGTYRFCFEYNSAIGGMQVAMREFEIVS